MVENYWKDSYKRKCSNNKNMGDLEIIMGWSKLFKNKWKIPWIRFRRFDRSNKNFSTRKFSKFRTNDLGHLYHFRKKSRKNRWWNKEDFLTTKVQKILWFRAMENRDIRNRIENRSKCNHKLKRLVVIKIRKILQDHQKLNHFRKGSRWSRTINTKLKNNSSSSKKNNRWTTKRWLWESKLRSRSTKPKHW